MDTISAQQLLTQLRELDECPHIEAKRASDVGPSIMQTICAFANEPGLGGGYLLLGVSEPDEAHETFWVSGVEDTDKLLNEIQVNCRDQFETPVPVHCQVTTLEGKRLVVIYVPELEPAAKPCTFKGKFDSKNKRKTGVWRRGLNGDYECSQGELEPILLAKAGTRFEQVVLDDAEWEDLDPDVIQLYRQLRAKVRPQAKELQASDVDMLRALNLVKRCQDGQIRPNIAGLLLLGKPLSLRRLLPAVRVDYVRTTGIRWVENPHQRFDYTQDFREPLLRLIPKVEAAILDDLPRHFRLEEGQTQRSDTPLLPYKVVREAVVNAVMHRDYSIHQPTLIVRFSNRLEIRNAGYSLKPEERLGDMGSELRNPILASMLYDLEFAEAKGTGISTMRHLLALANMTAPVFHSDVIGNQFTATYLLHQLTGEEQLRWLSQFASHNLSDQEAKALLIARALGAVDNAALRYVSGLDALAASQVLGKLHRQRELLVKGGAGSGTYYQLAPSFDLAPEESLNAGGLVANTSDLQPNARGLEANTRELRANTRGLQPNTRGQEASDTAGKDLPPELEQALNTLSAKARKQVLWPLILRLCAIRPFSADELARLLRRKPDALKTSHLTPLREDKGFLRYLHPQVISHPEQAYITTDAGKQWLQQ